MKYIIAVFRSRTTVLQFCDLLAKYNIDAKIINTPREASLGCGLSVKFYECDFDYVNNILKAGKYNSFAGFFVVNERGHHKVVRPY